MLLVPTLLVDHEGSKKGAQLMYRSRLHSIIPVLTIRTHPFWRLAAAVGFRNSIETFEIFETLANL
jgi:hypothetical protein